MAANGQRKQDKLLTNSPDGPVADKLPSTESKVLKCEILQLSFPRLKAIVGKENNGGIIPEISRGGIIGAKTTRQDNQKEIHVFTCLNILNAAFSGVVMLELAKNANPCNESS